MIFENSDGLLVPKCDINNPTSPNHLIWMLDEMSNMDGTKVHRWLGYMQGILISQGITTVKAEGDYTRSYFKENL